MTGFSKFQYAARLCRGEYTMINTLNLSSVKAWQSQGYEGDVVADSWINKQFQTFSCQQISFFYNELKTNFAVFWTWNPLAFT